MQFREQNLSVLRRTQPALAERFATQTAGSADIVNGESKNGLPFFKFKDHAFHSAYRPDEEGARFASTIPDGVTSIWVYGLGYGWHLSAVVDTDLKITVIEPSEDIFCSALAHADLTKIFERCHIIVGSPIETIYASDVQGSALLVHKPYERHFAEGLRRLDTAMAVRSFLNRRRLRVMLAGPIYGGSETTFRYVHKALENLGAEVLPFDVTGYAKPFFGLKQFTGNALHVSQLQALFSNMLGEAAAAYADDKKPDLILVMAQSPIDTHILARLKALEVPMAFWFVEDFRTLKYWDRVAPYYDYFFTIQRGEFFEKLNSAGARRVAYLPQAAAPTWHRPVPLTDEERKKYGSTVSFMGAGYRNRHEFFKGILDYDLKVWGTEWNLQTPVGQRVQNRNERMSPEEYVKIFSASAINLNLHSSTLLAGIDPVGDFVNPRVFELAACGAFQLVDNRAELPPLMEPGKEIETFGSLSELREKIDYYIANPEARQKVAEAGRKRVLEEHTFERRMEDLLRIIIEYEGSSFGPKISAPSSSSCNLVSKMIEEAKDLPELQAFLKQFDPDKTLSLNDVEEQIAKGKGKLSRVESIMQMIRHSTVQG